MQLLSVLVVFAVFGHCHGGTQYKRISESQENGAQDWTSAYKKARAMVSQMTLEEMNGLTYGIGSSTGCVGTSGGVARLGFPGLCFQDAENGVRSVDGASSFASGIHVGASWNPSVAYERALYMGAEFKTKGVNVALGPVVGPIGRIAQGGRNWEGFATDPYLTGILGAETVRGMQKSVITSVKHYIGNEQETNRNLDTTTSTDAVSSNIDDQTMHELYLWPFHDAVEAGTGCIMCSYNRINNTYGCSNNKTMNDLLKTELDFKGFMVSDWGAQHDQLPSAQAGLDVAMPNSQYWQNGALADAVGNGTLNKDRLVDMATRIVATWYQFGQDSPSYPVAGVGVPSNLNDPHDYVNAKDPVGKPALLQQAIEGHVLVKNNGALPLKNPRVLSIFGYGATVQEIYDDNSFEFSFNWEIANNLTQGQITIEGQNGIVSNPPTTANGVLIVGGGSGSNTPSYISSPYDALQARAYEDNFQLFHDFTSNNPTVEAASDACIVVINAYSSEGWDRTTGLTDATSDQLVTNVASQCANTIVVIHNAGPRIVDAWVDNPRVAAVIFAHLPGQDAGQALGKILFGDVSPSGRLPYTLARDPTDYGNLLAPGADGTQNPQCDFTESVEIDYRGFLARNVTPRFEFGYGLTYTNFTYSNLNDNVRASSGVGTGQSLLQTVGSIKATIHNTGSVEASEVAQLYLQLPGANTRALRGFQKLRIAPGKSEIAQFNLRRKDISSWNAVTQAWEVPKGKIVVYVGKSVLDSQLQGSITI
ncbi:glycoside hydrolase family 3 protein [Penicillium lagena]|uniref:glycoside hydrolase family 3 protein n=1 Tax=Penicillium lagena TaxID=94218 RepID=UPI00253F67A5|nr:glycoside hydrolase family 3 protein [Penicillium lagena]KAJ5605311.1 glycoside hydrolase family 3 protein [Penicillium lagena]